MEKIPRLTEVMFCYRLRNHTCVIAPLVIIPHYYDLLVPDDSDDSPANETKENGLLKHPPPCRNPKRKHTYPAISSLLYIA